MLFHALVHQLWLLTTLIAAGTFEGINWLNKIDNEVYRIKGKALWATAWAIAIVVISEYLHIPDAKYMSSLFFGYGSLRVLG